MKFKWLSVLVVLLILVVGAALQAQDGDRLKRSAIVYFTADRTEIEAGGCVTLSYYVIGARQITLQGSNWLGSVEVITDNPNQRIVCPSAAAGYVPGESVTYTLSAIFRNRRTDSRSVTVYQLPAPQPTWQPTSQPTWQPTSQPTWQPTSQPTWQPTSQPSSTPLPQSTQSGFYIAYFSADRTTIEAGGCVTLSYHVVGAQQITMQGSNWLGHVESIADNPNQRMICPSAAGGYIPGEPVTYTLNVVYLNGLTDTSSVTIYLTLP